MTCVNRSRMRGSESSRLEQNFLCTIASVYMGRLLHFWQTLSGGIRGDFQAKTRDNRMRDDRND